MVSNLRNFSPRRASSVRKSRITYRHCRNHQPRPDAKLLSGALRMENLVRPVLGVIAKFEELQRHRPTSIEARHRMKKPISARLSGIFSRRSPRKIISLVSRSALPLNSLLAKRTVHRSSRPIPPPNNCRSIPQTTAECQPGSKSVCTHETPLEGIAGFRDPSGRRCQRPRRTPRYARSAFARVTY